jgi:predicted HTH domain antitoxin
MPKLVLAIPEDVQAGLKLPPADALRELREELAVALYRRQALSLGKARRLAELSHWEFAQLLGRHGVTRHYTDADLDEDLEYAGVR